MASANHVENIYLARESARRVLAIARGRTDRIHHLRLGIGLGTHRFGYLEKSLQLDRRLRDNQRRSQLWQRRNLARIANDISIVRRIANDTNHLRMVRIAGDYNVSPILRGSF